MESTGAQSSNELQWLEVEIEKHDSSLSNGHQGENQLHKIILNLIISLMIMMQGNIYMYGIKYLQAGFHVMCIYVTFSCFR